MKIRTCEVWAAWLLCLFVTAQATRYEYFDDFLLSISQPTETPAEEPDSNQPDQILSVNVDRTTGSDVSAEEGDNELVSDLEILGYFREVPREHWSCCMLGKLAGDKGFHCHAGFYQARIQMRNPNRAHNQRMLFHGPHAIPDWGQGIMRTFERCVARHSADFHKCCYAAAIERRERHRWFQYRATSEEEEN